MAAMPPSMPQAPPNISGQNPMAAMAQKPQPKPEEGSSGSLLQMLLAFLAGNGLKPAMDALKGLTGGNGGGRGAKGGNQQRPHKAAGVSVQGSAQPGAQVTPSAQGQGLPPGGQAGGGAIPPALLQKLIAMIKGGQAQ